MHELFSGRLSRFAVCAFLVAGLLLIPGTGNASASFCVGDDGFSISNAPGYCFAMTAFSRWYYLRHQGEPSLRKVVDKKVQERIAREIQQYYSKNLINIQADYCNRFHGNQTDSFQRFLAGVVAGEPQIVLLMNKGARGAVLHAVLAYEWVPEQNILKIYDPNYTNGERFIDLDRREYTSLDVTYSAICFPTVLHHHPGLVKKMEALYSFHVARKLAARSAAAAASQWNQAEARR
ncbi:MAG: hypothetical protein HY913_09990 [Desulfomonile tiedjei]|nr:hypothetical protein [Desulfomonile tiedjei]